MVDPPFLPVCENVRANRHRTFRGVANGTHSSTTTTFGLKLYLVLTEKQKITQFGIKYSDRKKVAPKTFSLGNGHRKVSIPFWLYAFQIPFPNSGFRLFFSRYFCL
ncbi:MAG: transposase [Puniceicoccales bacterium]|nr:transposase [Puniceicoccales bacterium]